MINQLELWLETHPRVMGLAAMLVPFAFKRLRMIPVDVFRMAQRWLAKERLAWQADFTEQVLGRLDSIEAKADKADKAIFNGGKTGIVQQLQLLTAEANKDFDEAPIPMFKCDIHGKNLLTNAAYRRLIGATKEESLEGTRWMSVIYGELAVYYIESFKRCTESEEDFQCETDFRNPMTGEHRGRWRVIAPVLHVGNGAIWVGSLEYALDDKANELADTLGLEVKRQ